MKYRSIVFQLAAPLFLNLLILQPLGAQVEAELGDLTVTGVNYGEEGEQPFTMYISGREMRIDQPGGMSMIFRLSGDRPGMLFLNHERKKVDFLPAEMVNLGESAVSARTLMTYETDPDPLPGMEALSPIPGAINVVRGGTEEAVPVDPEKVGFYYEGDTTLPGMDQASVPPEMRDMLQVVMRIESRAAVDPNIDGAEVAAAFYEEVVNSGLSAPSGFSSMSSGLMAVSRDIASVGFPVWTGTLTRIRVEVDGPMAGMMEGAFNRMPGIGRTLAVSVVESVSTDPVDPGLFYDGGMPPDYEVEVLDVGS